MSPLRTKKGVVAIFALVIALFFMTSIYGADGFDSIRCGSDVRKALLGRTMSNEKIVVLEERHKELGLKDVGASEISGSFKRNILANLW
jgi:hypothetical protein